MRKILIPIIFIIILAISAFGGGPESKKGNDIQSGHAGPKRPTCVVFDSARNRYIVGPEIVANMLINKGVCG